MNSKFRWCWVLMLAVLAGPQLLTAQAQEDSKLKPLPDGTIRFEFTDQPWADVIETYAENAGLDLTMIEPPPTGNFKFQGNRDMSYLEALDLLNEHMIPYGRILIRKEHSLYVFDMNKGIPESMIQTVAPEALDERGKYEIVKCNFDVEGLDALNLRNQIEPLIDDVHRRRMAVVDVSGLLIIQERAGQLRFIRDKIIEAAKKTADDWIIVYLPVKYALPEDVIVAAQQMIGLNADTGSTEDGSLTVQIDRNGDKLLVSGKPGMVKRMEALIKTVDQDFPAPENALPDALYASYRVEGNVELIHEVLQSMMSGRSIKLDFDAATNRIHVWGRPADHADIQEVIDKTGGGSGNFSVVTLDTLDPDEAKEMIEEAFDLGVDESEDAPTITELPPNRLVIRGNPAVVSEIEQMLTQIDVRFQRAPGSRTVERSINMTKSEVDRTMGMLSEVVPSLRLPNQIDVVLPGEQKWKYNRENRAFEIHREDEIMRETEERIREIYGDDKPESGEESGSPKAEEDGESKKADSGNQTSLFSPSRSYRLQAAAPGPEQIAVRNSRIFTTASFQEATQEEEHRNGSGRTSTEEQGDEQQQVDGQQDVDPVDEIKSVPGAPITLYIHSRGITIHTEDLDAGDKLENLIMDELTATLTDENMKLFLLQHRDAMEAKTQLELYLGLGGGGSGGGGMGDLMGGFMRNALPGGAGGMAEALLGGGGGGSGGGSIRELAGEVAIVADAKQYSLLVSAVSEDMELIEQLIDLIDQPTAIQNPNPNGRTRLIPIKYVDPETLEGMVRSNLQTVLRNAEAANGNQPNRQNNMEAAILRRMLGGGGGAGGGTEQEAPKAALSVDTRNRMLVVTGPRFIYDQIFEFVQLVDRKIDLPPQESAVVEVPNIDVELLAQLLQAQDPNIEILVDESSTSTTPANRTNLGGASGARTSNPVMANEAFMNAIRQGMQRQRGGGSQRGGGNRGGGNRGGGRGGR